MNPHDIFLPPIKDTYGKELSSRAKIELISITLKEMKNEGCLCCDKLSQNKDCPIHKL